MHSGNVVVYPALTGSKLFVPKRSDRYKTPTSSNTRSVGGRLTAGIRPIGSTQSVGDIRRLKARQPCDLVGISTSWESKPPLIEVSLYHNQKNKYVVKGEADEFRITKI